MEVANTLSPMAACGAYVVPDEPAQHPDHGDHAGAVAAVLHWPFQH